MMSLNRKKLGNKNRTHSFLDITKSCTILITSGLNYGLDPDVIGKLKIVNCKI